MEVTEIAPGLWRWTAPHPDWAPGEGWEREVGCVLYEGPDRLVLIDPLVPADEAERFWRHLDADVERAARPVSVLVTVDRHARSSRELAERYGATVQEPPSGVERFPVPRGDEAIFWLPEPRALVPGDVLLGREDGALELCPGSWLPRSTTLETLARSLRPLLDLPVERVLVSHGEPVLEDGRGALSRALAAHSPPSAE